MSYGGVSEARPATPEIQEIADNVRPQLEGKTNEKYEKFKAVEYKSQVVSGIIYFIKVDVGNGCFIHIKVFSGPSGKDNYELHSYQTNKTKNDELTDF
ncbi:stefin-1-like [Arvicanthis niloticus]|uniref:stefin-1-like n=1 Tax=Arvicanthis niloticus TaxID=61156 RepID=UPI001485DFBA|nr:stefin-1-like [Arvicanthis niloticus]